MTEIKNNLTQLQCQESFRNQVTFTVEKIGEKLKTARERKNLSQEELGERIGVSHAAISKIESGGNASRQTMISLGKELEEDFGVTWLQEHLSKFNKQIPVNINFDSLLETKIREIVRNELGRPKHRTSRLPVKVNNSKIQDLGSVDEKPSFNLEEAVQKYDTLEETLDAWFKTEGRELPADFAINFHDWKSYSFEKRIVAVEEVKKFADVMLGKMERGELDDE